ncbi:transglycosylase domain-containing protein [Salisediminibacterium halotolerans]|uniref:transglycosylase domain-containing protein n=1 Tax=Salisediminibacterium halotolerans TaxID=517425 RepID=UPI000EAC4702|nr:PBP1A family penicillin-binding protein [Salisediminibacterium halotolerans]RLJ77903.1 penicillin-binding protein 1A [Actinophytocola xinjiangensis]RPE88759.1 penicillin-binding protein 1A [Salisediminibacterium halotolerans]TWG36880.1 penicillin-binding protein 1A [Salisediminibacterium halotolerans]GEL09190.1 penicillin-binding protein 1A/1B [Salisediminibacterium halotolerans]
MADENYSRQARRKTKKSPENDKKTNLKKGGKGKKLLTALAVFLLVLFIAGAVTVASIISGAPEIDRDDLVMSQNPEIMDIDDELVTSLDTGENRRYADIDEIPDLVQDAFISIEDERFYDHFGVDVRRIGGAVIANITGGFGSEGASTITQQLVKNLYFDFDKTITRKLQEQYLAVRLEQQYTKDQILEMYLNAIYFSGSRYGVVEASDYFFSKSLDELTIEDAALIAGIPQRPSAHNPFNNPEAAENRRNTVIDRMERNDVISAEEAEEAKAVAVEDQLNQGGNSEGEEYQAYLDQVLEEVEAIDGIEWNDIYSSGLKIYTNLDQDLQSYVNEVMNEEVVDFPDEYFQAGITLMDTTNGRVHALGGQRGESEGARQLNWATNSQAGQAGSTAKPIFAYGPGIDNMQWPTAKIFDDSEHYYSNSDQQVRNFDRQHLGDMTMREALKDSRNVPAVQAIQEAGLDHAEEFGENLHVPMGDIGESYALGANYMSSLDMAGAYGAFGNNGEYNEPFTVRGVEFRDGQTIDLEPEPEEAMNDYTAYMITDMLRDVLTDGTGTSAQIPGIDIAGKTGSTNYTDDQVEQYNIPANHIKDSWFAGYSTDLTAAVWTGYPSVGDGQINMNEQENAIARSIFREIMEYAHEDRDPGEFTQPDSVVELEVEESTGLLPGPLTPDDEIITELFVRGHEPEDESDEFAELSGISNLSASYNEDEDRIDVSWDYEGDEEVEFEVEVQEPDADDYQSFETTSGTEYQFTGPAPGETYSIRVTAVAVEDDDIESDSATVEVTIPDDDEDDDEENNEENNNEDNNEENNNNNNEENNEENENDNNNNNANENNEDDNNEMNNEPENNNENNTPAENNNNGNNTENNNNNTNNDANNANEAENTGNEPAEAQENNANNAPAENNNPDEGNEGDN